MPPRYFGDPLADLYDPRAGGFSATPGAFPPAADDPFAGFDAGPATRQYLAELMAEQPEPSPFEPEQAGRLENFLTALQGVDAGPYAGPGMSFVSGLARGLGGAGAARGQAREQRNKVAMERAAKADERNRAASAKRLEGLRFVAGEELQTQREAGRGGKESTEVLLTPELRAQHPELARLPETTASGKPMTVPREWLKGKEAKPLDPAALSAYNSAVRADPKLQRFDQIRFGADLVKNGNASQSPAGDIAIVYGYMKMLDPTSVVREGEFATAANAAGVPERVRQQYNNMLKGDLLDQKVRDDYLKNADKIYKTEHGQYSAALGRYNRQGRGQRIPEDQMEAIQPFQSIIAQPSKAAASVVDKVLGGRN